MLWCWWLAQPWFLKRFWLAGLLAFVFIFTFVLSVFRLPFFSFQTRLSIFHVWVSVSRVLRGCFLAHISRILLTHLRIITGLLTHLCNFDFFLNFYMLFVAWGLPVVLFHYWFLTWIAVIFLSFRFGCFSPFLTHLLYCLFALLVKAFQIVFYLLSISAAAIDWTLASTRLRSSIQWCDAASVVGRREAALNSWQASAVDAAPFSIALRLLPPMALLALVCHRDFWSRSCGYGRCLFLLC